MTIIITHEFIRGEPDEHGNTSINSTFRRE